MPVSVRTTDSGYGDARAEPGSEQWAKRWRVDLYAAVQRLDSDPGLVESFIQVGEKFKAWRVLGFLSFDDFCAAPWPGGLGADPGKVRRYLEALHGKRAVQLTTVSPARKGNRFTVETAPGTVSSTARSDQLLRAILRAPSEVQDLYRDGLISQKLAARLGPKDPARAPSRERVVEALAGVPRERRAIDGAVRELVGARRDRVMEIVRAFLRLDARQRRRFYEEVERESP